MDMSPVWQNEYKKSIKNNGAHVFRFYYKKMGSEKILITYKEFLESKSLSTNTVSYVTHVGFKCNVDEFTSCLSLFTSKSESEFPGIGLVQNVKVGQPNMFKYVNLPIFISNKDFSLFFTTHNDLNDFPSWCSKYDKKLIVKNSCDAFTDSYVAAKKSDIYFARVLYGHLIFNWYTNYSQIIQWQFNYRPYNSNSLTLKIYLGFLNQVKFDAIEKLDNKMVIEGFSVEDYSKYISCLF